MNEIPYSVNELFRGYSFEIFSNVNDLFFQKKDKDGDDDSDDEEETIQIDLNKLSESERIKYVKQNYPEYFGLVAEFHRIVAKFEEFEEREQRQPLTHLEKQYRMLIAT